MAVCYMSLPISISNTKVFILKFNEEGIVNPLSAVAGRVGRGGDHHNHYPNRRVGFLLRSALQQTQPLHRHLLHLHILRLQLLRLLLRQLHPFRHQLPALQQHKHLHLRNLFRWPPHLNLRPLPLDQCQRRQEFGPKRHRSLLSSL